MRAARGRFDRVAVVAAPGGPLVDAIAATGRAVVVGAEPDVGELADVDLVVDATGGDLPSARDLLGWLDAVVPPGVPFVVLPAGHSVTELAAATRRPTLVCGWHVVDRVAARGVIEVVRGMSTDEGLVEELAAFAGELADATIVVDDRPGLLLEALFVPYLNDVIRELDDGLASAEDIDVALELGLGYRVGPLRLLDGFGLDRHRRLTAALHERTGDARYAPPPLLERMVAAGRSGDEVGSGFRADRTGEGR